jgi:hypothetical protein
MAKLPTPEDSALFLISHMVSAWSGRPGHVFNFRMINVFCMENHAKFTAHEFNEGLTYAVDQKWLEKTSESKYPSYKLTMVGFEVV